MSKPDPEVYEQGRGMDAHNQAMREIRARNDASYDPREPTRVWLDEDRTPDGVYDSLTIILNTGGCRWARAGGCTMCGYVAESVEGGAVAHEDLMTQVESCLDYEAENTGEASSPGSRTQSDDAGEASAPGSRTQSDDVGEASSPGSRTQSDDTGESAGQVKIYTSGSFLDEREIPAETRAAIAEIFADRDRIVVESLPDFVTEGKIADFTEHDIETDVAVGLETATDRVRHDCVNKYFDFAEFERAAADAAAAGAGVKAYLLMKPPFLSESEAIADMKRSVRRCSAVEGCHTVSMNPTNVQKYTMVEELYYNDGYRPPWLWSVAEVLESTAEEDVIVVSDPVGHGSDRGPHNCGECDDRVQRAIKDFDLRQDPSVFDQVSCECELTWEAVRERERSYSLPLVS